MSAEFMGAKIAPKFGEVMLNGGIQHRCGIKGSRFSSNVSLYLENGRSRYTVTIRNRTLGAIYRMVALLVTLNDLRSLQVL